MRLIKFAFKEQSHLKKLGLTIGSFDCIHQGHYKLISHLIQNCQRQGLASMVMTFEQVPKVTQQKAPFSIHSLSERIALFKKLGVDYLCLIRFKNIASLSPEAFIQDIFQTLPIQSCLLGEDFRFGHDAKGDIALLKALATTQNIECSSIPIQKDQGLKISTTFIREALLKQSLELANQWLYEPYHIQGHIKEGLSLGKKIGFPTANLACRKFLPLEGVFLTQMQLKQKLLWGVTNIGYKPTILKNNAEKQIETHLLDYQGEDFYRQKIKLTFHQRLRSEKLFDSINDLKSQIKADISQAYHLIEQNKSYLKEVGA